MNREEQNFDQLRRLLKLKRYEQPHPRYFNNFSTQVVARLRSEQSSGLSANWLQRLWAALELKPIIPAALGTAICGLLVAGAVYTEANPDTRVPDLDSALNTLDNSGVGHGLGTVAGVPIKQPTDFGLASSSTNPVTGGSLFDQIPLSMQPRRLADHPLFK